MHCYISYMFAPLIGTLGALQVALIGLLLTSHLKETPNPLYARLCSVAAVYPNMASTMPECARHRHTCRWQTEPFDSLFPRWM